ncbi:MAG: DUF87 domain-containing protein [bacterium]|nr:DUF87 domain-containing protein [bacterium]
MGSSTSRRRLLICSIYLWSAAFVPLLSYRHQIHEILRQKRSDVYAEQVETQRKTSLANENAAEDSISRGAKKLEQERAAKKRSFELSNWNGDLKSIPSFAIELQPFQQRMLLQMPQAERADYLHTALNIARYEPTPYAQNTEEDLSATVAPKDKTSAFFLYSQIYHPYKWDVAKYTGEESRIGFSFIGAFFLIGIDIVLFSVASFLFPLAFFYAASVRTATYLRAQLEAHPDSILSFGNWDRLVEDLTQSNDPTEKSSLLLGVNAKDGSPVMLPRKVLQEHAHILGDSGSGKTSLGISLILNQLIKQPDCSIVVIDLKGDDTALFEGTRQDAQSVEKPFRWFTNELGRSSYAFNPLSQAFFGGLSLYQKTDVITSSMGLQYGTDYGRGYFSDSNADYLYRTLAAHPYIRSFRQLARILPTGFGVPHVADLRKDASHVVSISQRLAATETLNVIDDGTYPQSVVDQQIDFADVFRRPQVVYLQLPSSLGTTSSAEIARIALYSLIGSARLTPDRERKQVFVFIDEFQRIVASNLELLMQTARSMKIGLILANQSIFDLKKPGVDLMPTVRTNTRYKQVFAASNADSIKELIQLSGEAMVLRKSFTGNFGLAGGLGGGLFNYSLAQDVSPRLRVNDILMATDHPEQSIVQVSRGDGYAQYGGMPFVMRSTFHISEDEYNKRKEASWPEPNDGTLIGTETTLPSPLDEFEPVDPNAPLAPNRNSSQGLDSLLDSFQQPKRNLDKRRTKKKPSKPKKSDDQGSAQ